MLFLIVSNDIVAKRRREIGQVNSIIRVTCSVCDVLLAALICTNFRPPQAILAYWGLKIAFYLSQKG